MTSFLVWLLLLESHLIHTGVVYGLSATSHSEFMKLEEFLQIWEVTREELAFICDCSVTTVNHWFSQGEHRRFPNEKHQQKLALTHHIWTTIETEPEYLRVLREMYYRKPRRR